MRMDAQLHTLRNISCKFQLNPSSRLGGDDNHLLSYPRTLKFLSDAQLQGWERLRTKKQYINSTPKSTDSTVPTVQTVHLNL